MQSGMNATPPPAFTGLSLRFRLCLERYREHLEAKGHSSHTVRSYTHTAKDVLGYLAGFHIETLREVLPQHLHAYQNSLMETRSSGKPRSLRTVTLRLTEVRAFFAYLHAQGEILLNSSLSLVLPKAQKRLPRFVPPVNDMASLIEAPILDGPLGLRDRAILELLYSCGLRSSEARAMEVADLDMRSRVLFVRGKGGKDALVPFGKTAAKALVNYLHHGRPKLTGKGGDAQPYLFLSKSGRSITSQNLLDMVRRHAKALNLQGNISPHGLRHACATHLLQNGADIRHIQKLLRHSSLNTTQIYTRLCIDDLKTAQERYHPREKIAAKTDAEISA